MQNNQTYQFPYAAYPALRLMILLMAGICIAHFWGNHQWIIIFVVAFSSWLVSELILRKFKPVYSSAISTCTYIFIVLTAGAALYQFSIMGDDIDTIAFQNLQLFEWEELIVHGEIAEAGKSGTGRNVYEMDVHKTIFENGLVWNYKFRLRLYDDIDHETTILKHNEITARIRLYSFPERRNPHEFNYGNWLLERGIAGHGEILEVLEHSQRGVFGWEPMRAIVRNNVNAVFDNEQAILARALLLGDKEELTTETRQQFSRSGLSHIMAVSGLHVGFIVAPFWLLIPFLWGNRYGKLMGLLILTLLLFGYAGLTGFSPSVSRASLMAWLLTYGKLFHKVRNSINITAVAAIIILLIDPQQLFEVGFQLSFAAVFIILLIMPEAQRLIPGKWRFGFAGGLITIILVSIVVQIGLFPILIHYFGEFAVVGPVANALVVPILSFTVPVGLLLVLLSPLSPVFFQMGALPVKYLLQWIEQVASLFGTQAFSYLTFDNAPVFLFLIWFFAILFIASIRIPGIRWKLLAAFLLCANFMMAELILNQPSSKKLTLTFLDVGQGDAIHIQTPNDKHILVDAGLWSPMSNSGQRVLLPYFDFHGIDRLDAVILSHPHADHIGGMPDLIENLHIGAIYQSDYHYDSELYLRYMQLAKEKNIPVNYAFSGDLIDIDPGVRIFVLGPEEGTARDRNPNNHSVAFKLVYGEKHFLFTGDAEIAQERQLAQRYGDFLKSDLYKAGHHASNTSSNDFFLQYVEPDLSVASLAFRNVFGHPGGNAVQRLNEYSARQKYTSLSGGLIFTADGSTIEKTEWRQNK